MSKTIDIQWIQWNVYPEEVAKKKKKKKLKCIHLSFLVTNSLFILWYFFVHSVFFLYDGLWQGAHIMILLISFVNATNNNKKFLSLVWFILVLCLSFFFFLLSNIKCEYDRVFYGTRDQIFFCITCFFSRYLCIWNEQNRIE